jgi:Rps23 Pro-64 3,4-dihydroxylase Tpa1-like proline 4-hydroxylase
MDAAVPRGVGGDEKLAAVASLIVSALQRSSQRQGNAEVCEEPALFADALPQQLLDESHAETLRSGGVVVLEDFLQRSAHPEAAATLLDDLLLLHATGRMQLSPQALTGARGDRVAWLSEREAAALSLPSLASAIRTLKSAAAQLNAHCGMRLVVPARAQVASYDGDGAHYRCHWDNCRGGSNRRAMTLVTYAAPDDWSEGDGGALRCHTGAPACPEDEQDASSLKAAAAQGQQPLWPFVDVQPRTGRLALFDSKQLLHEVRPCCRQRCAVTLWAFDIDALTAEV